MRKFIFTTLIGGFLVILPLAIFIGILSFVYGIVENLIQPIAKLFSDAGLPEILLNLIALGIVIGFCFLVGLFVRTRIGNTTFQYVEKEVLDRLPFYNTIREIVQQVFGKKESSFSQVVLLKVFGSTMTGFVTDQSANDIYTIFVPTAPNPTNGFVVHMHKEEINFVDTSPEDAMRTIIGVGTGSHILFEPELKEEVLDGTTGAASPQED